MTHARTCPTSHVPLTINRIVIVVAVIVVFLFLFIRFKFLFSGAFSGILENNSNQHKKNPPSDNNVKKSTKSNPQQLMIHSPKYDQSQTHSVYL